MDEEPEKDKKIKNKIKSKRGGLWKKAVVKYLQTWIGTLIPPDYSDELREEWIKVSWFCFDRTTKMRSYCKKGTIQLTCATFVTGCPAIHVYFIFIFCRDGNTHKKEEEKKKTKERRRKSDVRVKVYGLAPRLWLLWVIVVHSSLT